MVYTKGIKSIFFISFIILFLNFRSISPIIEYFDTTFGVDANGIVITEIEIGNSSKINGITRYSDDQIVAAGVTTTTNNVKIIAVARYNSDGTLDNSFGINGIVQLSIGTSAIANAVITNSNKIVIAGTAIIDGANNIFAARLNADGSPDLNFGIGGIATLLVGSSSTANGVAVDADGKVIVVGTAIVSDVNNIVVGRFNFNGSLDATFNGTGSQTLVDGNGYIGNSLQINQNAKLVVGGAALTVSGSDFLVARFNVNGSADSTFGTNGVTTTSIASTALSEVKSIFIDSSNRIVAGGFSGSSNSKQFTVARYNDNGTLDTSFGASLNGYQVTTIGTIAQVNSVVDQNGKIIAGGVSDKQFAIARYETNGSLDTTFGINGILVEELGSDAAINSAIVQTSDSRVVIGGYSASPCCPQFTLARYNNNNTDFINILSITTEDINTKIPVISGSSSLASAQVEIIINGNLFNTVSTNGLGDWNAGQTNVLPIGNNVIQVNLISDSNVVVSQKINVNVVDSFGEDSVFAFSTSPQTSTDAIYMPLPFNNLIRLGTWTYSDSVFTCNKSGTYLVEHVGNAGLTGTPGATSVDVAMMVAINNTQYLGSESDATLDLDPNLARTITRSFVKDFIAGDTLTVNMAVNIFGSNLGFSAGLMMSANAIGSQPTYSLTITRIS